MDLANLSGNWKKLQKTLEKERDKIPAKGKRVGDEPSAIPSKHPKLTGKNRPVGERDRNRLPMSTGLNPSRARSSSTPSKPEKAFPDKSVTALKKSRSHADFSKLNGQEYGKINEGNSERAVGGKYVALDCEMVGIGPAPHKTSQLARVSLVNYHGDQIYDSFVLPNLPVTDFRTKVSGITAALLKEGRPFSEVQADVATLLQARVLVGHGLQNDLEVLSLSHPRRDLRDTSRHKPFREAYGAGRAPSLRTLAQEVLGLEKFQEESHNSVEDARVAMLLFKQEKDAFELNARKNFGVKGRRVANKPTSTTEVSAIKNTTAKKRGKKKRSKK